MNIYLDDDLRAVRAQTADYVEREIVPKAEAWEAEGRVPREVLRHMGGVGFFGLRVPEEYGGIGLGPLVSCSPSNWEVDLRRVHDHRAHHTDLAMPITRSVRGDETAIPPMMAGRHRGARRHRSPTRNRRRLDPPRPTGRRRLRPRRTKTFITNGVEGDLVVVAAKTDPGAKALHLIVRVERGTPGSRWEG